MSISWQACDDRSVSRSYEHYDILYPVPGTVHGPRVANSITALHLSTVVFWSSNKSPTNFVTRNQRKGSWLIAKSKVMCGVSLGTVMNPNHTALGKEQRTRTGRDVSPPLIGTRSHQKVSYSAYFKN